MISFTATMFLALVLFVSSNPENSNNENYSLHSGKMLETNYYSQYAQLKPSKNVVVIYPILTQSAYEWGGQHDYLLGRCDTCKTTQIQNHYEKRYAASGNGFGVLEFLGYTIIDDIDVDKNPKILENFDQVILLHNEYVTKAQFDAVTSHQNVIYLYPNALRSEVIIDYEKFTSTLVLSPELPKKDNGNAFDWEYDNSEFFNDWECENWEFYDIPNGKMLNCYPDKYLKNDGFDLLQEIKNL